MPHASGSTKRADRNTTEDAGIVIGQAMKKALDDFAGTWV
jgi:imidazoleglycerol phosphate dehydratase HisB